MGRVESIRLMYVKLESGNNDVFDGGRLFEVHLPLLDILTIDWMDEPSPSHFTHLNVLSKLPALHPSEICFASLMQNFLSTGLMLQK